MDDVLSLYNYRFDDFVDRIYPIEFEIKDTTVTDRSASCLHLDFGIDSDWLLRTILYDKRDYFNFQFSHCEVICRTDILQRFNKVILAGPHGQFLDILQIMKQT